MRNVLALKVLSQGVRFFFNFILFPMVSRCHGWMWYNHYPPCAKLIHISLYLSLRYDKLIVTVTACLQRPTALFFRLTSNDSFRACFTHVFSICRERDMIHLPSGSGERAQENKQEGGRESYASANKKKQRRVATKCSPYYVSLELGLR